MADDRTGPTWTPDVGAGSWIADRLRAGDVVPRGFERYALVLHPADGSRSATEPVRWRKVADWSGLPLHAGSGFASIAIPQQPRHGPPPWSGQGPVPGQLFLPDLRVLQVVLTGATTTPDDSWFGLWEGYGWIGGSGRGRRGLVRRGRRTSEQCRSGSPSAGLVGHDDRRPEAGPTRALVPPVPGPHRRRRPGTVRWHLGTDAEHLVAGGPGVVRGHGDRPAVDLGRRIGRTRRAACRRRAPRGPGGDPFAGRRPGGWIHAAAEAAAVRLVETGGAVIETPIGSVTATLAPEGRHRVRLASESRTVFRRGGRGSTSFDAAPRDRLEQLLVLHLVTAVEDLAG